MTGYNDNVIYMRTLKFDIITDSRFSPNPKEEQEQKEAKILKDLSGYGLNVKLSDSRILKFGMNDPTDKEPSISYRVAVYVQKNTMTITWNNIMQIINQTYVPYYSFVGT